MPDVRCDLELVDVQMLVQMLGTCDAISNWWMSKCLLRRRGEWAFTEVVWVMGIVGVLVALHWPFGSLLFPKHASVNQKSPNSKYFFATIM